MPLELSPGVEEPVPNVCRRARCVSGAPEHRPTVKGLCLFRRADTISIAQDAQLLARYGSDARTTGRRSLAIAGIDLRGVKPRRYKRMPHSSLATRARRRPREIECDSLVTLYGRAPKRTGCPPFFHPTGKSWWPTPVDAAPVGGRLRSRGALARICSLLDWCAHPQPGA
jgi:hypothetical protein